ncbi:MAG: protein kinase [Planctomycetes bacterium]|jgi:serine/threonine protein kinase|nr:protein kinase [Planctomycetota bacterium]
MSNSSDNGQVGLPIGTTIGKYEIVERRAIGGQAIVYKGYDSLLDRHVAIKQISSHLAENEKFLERFRREARILARLGAQQPAIVTIHELVAEQHGLFIVMEFLNGHSLETIIRETAGPSEPKAALQILWRLAAALHDVHQAGIIHRDIKPANIIVEDGLRPKITDFGVAASLSAQTSMLLGTTKYMAPEMFEGADIDGRADMYSLGMVAYELLAGRPKFNEVFADLVRDPHSEAMRWMKWHGNMSVSAPPLGEISPGVPAPLSDIVMKMLAKNPNDRFANMEALGRAIKQTFSPKARAAEAAPVAPRLQQVASAVSSPSSTDLELIIPPTAEIPRQKLSLKTKIIAASAAFVLLIVTAVALMISNSSSQDQARREVLAAYRSADDHYKAARFAEAAHEFELVAAKPRSFEAAAKASVMAPLAAARAGLLTAQSDEDWDNVATLASKARENAKEIQASRKNLVEWCSGIIDETERFETERTLERKFRMTIAEARYDYEQGRFTEAQTRLEQQLAGAMPPDKIEMKHALWHEIELAILNQRVLQAVSTGDELASRQDFAGASAAYERAINMAPSNKLPPPRTMTQKAQEIEAAIQQTKAAIGQKAPDLAGRQKYFEAIARADAASDAGDRRAELSALTDAAGIVASDALTQRIAMLQSQLAFEQGQQAVDQGDLANARRLFAKALEHNPDNQQATEQIALLDMSERRRTLVAEGDSLVLQDKLAEALEKFSQAAAIVGEPPMDERVSQCRFGLLIAEGDRLRKENKHREAIEAYEKAREVRPSEGDLITARQAATTLEEEYQGLLRKGDEHLAARHYGKAREAYAQARTKAESPELANKKIAFSIYQENLENGKEYIQLKNWNAAMAHLKTAKSKQRDAGIDNSEIDELIAQVEQQLNDSSE